MLNIFSICICNICVKIKICACHILGYVKFSYLTKHIHVIYYSYVHPIFLGKNVHKYQFIFIFLCVVILDIEENYIKK